MNANPGSLSSSNPSHEAAEPEPRAPAQGSLRLCLDQVAIGYGHSAVLEGLDLEVRAGDTVAIHGPNGGGKSTLLLGLLGVLPPLSGRMESFRGPLAPGPTSGPARLGYVPQHLGLDPVYPLTVADMLGFGALNLPRARRRGASLDALVRVGLQGFESRSFSALSGGQRQRILIARALVDPPDVLLLDEPLSAVDPESELGLLALFGELAQGGMAVLWVTHRLEHSLGVARAEWLVRGGRVEVLR